MAAPRPSISGNARQHGECKLHSVAKRCITRDSPVSPESEDGSGTPAEGSSGSERSYGLETLLLPEDQESIMEVLPSPEAQDELAMDADRSEEGSASLSSEYSFGIESKPLPEHQPNLVIPTVHISGVEDKGAETLPVVVTHDYDTPEHGRDFGVTSENSGNPEEGLAPVTDAEGITDSCSAARVWIWGEPAPSFRSATEMEERQASALSQATQEAKNDASNLLPLHDCTPADMLKSELERLRVIQNEIREIYEEQSRLVSGLEILLRESEIGDV